MDFRRYRILVAFVWRARFYKFVFQVLREFVGIRKEFGSSQTTRAASWLKNRFSSPAPNFVKWQVLHRWGSQGTWVETGTYFGETTEFLSRTCELIISIEPSPELATRAKALFESSKNVNIVNGTSEEFMGRVLDGLGKDGKNDLNFWLDGHYSAGVTYLGDKPCPIVEELLEIGERMKDFSCVSIFVDDVRAFSVGNARDLNYPNLDFLVNWANQHSLGWTIEHDIFIMTNRFQ